MASGCGQCGDKLGWDKPIAVAWLGEEIYSFCSTKCRHEFLYPRHPHRICAREGCHRRVPKGNRMLCLNCYQNGDHLGESDLCFDRAEMAHWQRQDRKILRRIEKKVRVFRSQNMTQRELSELVPSMHTKD